MPKVRRRRRAAYVGWEASETEENVVNASESSRNNNRIDTVGVGKRVDDSGTSNHANGENVRYIVSYDIIRLVWK